MGPKTHPGLRSLKHKLAQMEQHFVNKTLTTNYRKCSVIHTSTRTHAHIHL